MTDQQYDHLVTKLVLDAQAVCEGISELERNSKNYARETKKWGNMFYKTVYNELVKPNTYECENARTLFDLMEYNELMYKCIMKKGLAETMVVLTEFYNDEIKIIPDNKHNKIYNQLETA